MMRITTIAAALLALVTLVPSTWGQASTGTISIKGPFAEADILHFDPNTNLNHEVFVLSSTAAIKVPGGPAVGSAETIALYAIYDATTGVVSDSGSGFIDGTLSVADNHSSASLVASGTLTSSVLPNTTLTVAFDLGFTPNGPAEHLSAIEHITIATQKVVLKADETLVPSNLSGTATLGGVTLDQVIFADFGKTKSTTLTISK
jgi:hypothetical protein